MVDEKSTQKEILNPVSHPSVCGVRHCGRSVESDAESAVSTSQGFCKEVWTKNKQTTKRMGKQSRWSLATIGFSLCKKPTKTKTLLHWENSKEARHQPKDHQQMIQQEHKRNKSITLWSFLQKQHMLIS